MRRFGIMLLAYVVFVNAVTAGVVRYVKRTGGVTTGEALTEEDAWTWPYAVNGNTTVDPGDTIRVAPMSGNADSLFVDTGDGGSNSNRITIAGTVTNPIIIEPKPGTRITLYSNVTPAPWVLIDFQASAKHIRVRNFEIVHTSPTATDAAQTVSLGGDSNAVENNYIHDALSMGITDYAAHGSFVYGNVIAFCGRQTQISQHGYAGYIQNKGVASDQSEDAPPKWWMDNICHSEWNLTLQFYGSAASALANLHIRRNVQFNTGNLPDDGGVEKFMHLIVLGPGEDTLGVRAAKDTVVGNLFFYSTSPGTNQIFNFGYNGNPMFQVRIDSNMFVSNTAATGVEFSVGTSGATFGGNTVIGGMSPDLTSTFPNNVYHSTRPSGSTDSIYIHPNLIDPNRANVTIYNWDGSATASFDPSGILSSGDSYAVVSATNFYDTLYTGTYSGPITVTLADITMATPIGSFDNPPINPAPYFASLILFKTGEAGAAGETTYRGLYRKLY